MPIKITMFNGTTYTDKYTSLMDFNKFWTNSMKSCTSIMLKDEEGSIKYLNPYHIAHVEQDLRWYSRDYID